MSEHTRILLSRYKQLLSCVSNMDAMAGLLFAQGLLSQREIDEMGKMRMRLDKETHLCSCLTSRGVSKLVDISQVLKTEQARTFGSEVGVAAGIGMVESERIRGGSGGVAPVKEELWKAYDSGGHSQGGHSQGGHSQEGQEFYYELYSSDKAVSSGLLSFVAKKKM